MQYKFILQNSSTGEETFLNGTENSVGAGSKSESQFESNISSKRRLTCMLGNRADKPDLGHADNHSNNTKAEGGNGSDTNGQLFGLVVIFGVVTLGSLAEQEMFGETDANIDGKPVSNLVSRCSRIEKKRKLTQ
jgi:hypothetical protein